MVVRVFEKIIVVTFRIQSVYETALGNVLSDLRCIIVSPLFSREFERAFQNFAREHWEIGVSFLRRGSSVTRLSKSSGFGRLAECRRRRKG